MAKHTPFEVCDCREPDSKYHCAVYPTLEATARMAMVGFIEENIRKLTDFELMAVMQLMYDQIGKKNESKGNPLQEKR